MRILSRFATFVALSAAFGCSNGSDNPMAPGVPPAGSSILYAAVGASDVVGIGSSRPCSLPFEDCNGNSYVFVAARQLRSQNFTVTVEPLGIPGAVISRGFLDLALQYGRNDVLVNLIQSAMPFVKRESTLVTIFTGANDVNVVMSALGLGAGGNNPAAFIDEKIAAFKADFATLVEGTRDRARTARIVVFNVPNVAALPYQASAPLLQKQAAQRLAVGFNAAINATAGVAVVDLMCDARFYDRSNLHSDGFHPNDNGYALMAAEVVKAVTSASYPAPASSCGQMVAY
jgi:lysophospholipase L1-like esterase